MLKYTQTYSTFSKKVAFVTLKLIKMLIKKSKGLLVQRGMVFHVY